MLLGQYLAVVHWLNSSVIVILMHVAVDGSGHVLVMSRGDMLVLNGRVDRLMHGGMVLAILVEKFGNGCLSFLHFDFLW